MLYTIIYLHIKWYIMRVIASLARRCRRNINKFYGGVDTVVIQQ